MRALLACLLAGLALAGCSDAEPPATGADAGGDAAAVGPPEPQTQEFEFGLGAAVGTPAIGSALPVDDNRQVSFEVPEGYGLLEVTAAWACDIDAACDLDLELRRGEQNLQTAGFGPSPVTLSLEEPEAGRYTFWAFPSRGGSVIVGMQGTLTVALS